MKSRWGNSVSQESHQRPRLLLFFQTFILNFLAFVTIFVTVMSRCPLYLQKYYPCSRPLPQPTPNKYSASVRAESKFGNPNIPSQVIKISTLV